MTSTDFQLEYLKIKEEYRNKSRLWFWVGFDCAIALALVLIGALYHGF